MTSVVGLEISRVPGVHFLRLVNRLLPLKMRWYPLVKHLSSIDGFLSIPWGKYNILLPASWIGPTSILGYIFEGRDIIPEFSLLHRALPLLQEGTVVDVGANIGHYILEFRQHSPLPIVAYEPAPAIYEILNLNVDQNVLSNVELRSKACGKSSGTILMNVSINSSVTPTDNLEGDFEQSLFNDKRVVGVPLVTLDEDLQDQNKISLIKIDCEGFEYQILLGATSLIQQHHPVLFIELHPRFIEQYGDNLEDICKLLSSNNYELEFWDFDCARNYHKIHRYISYYFPNRGRQLRSEDEMLRVAEMSPRPHQLYLLAKPRNGTLTYI